MLGSIVKNEIVLYLMAALLGFSIVAKIISVTTTRKMVKAAGEIQKSNHRLIKLIKAKFEHARLISEKMQNVEAFVEKYMYEYKVFGIRLHTWRMVPQKFIWIIGCLGVFAVFESYRTEGMGELTAKYAQWTSVFLLFLLVLHFMTEEKMRLQATKNYIVEHLENVCTHRYAKRNQEVEEVKEEPKEEEIQEEPEEETLEIQMAKQQEEEERKKSDREMRIRAILEEFLA